MWDNHWFEIIHEKIENLSYSCVKNVIHESAFVELQLNENSRDGFVGCEWKTRERDNRGMDLRSGILIDLCLG